MSRPLALFCLILSGTASLWGEDAAAPAQTTPTPASAVAPSTPAGDKQSKTNSPASELEKLDAETRELKAGDVVRFGILQDPSNDRSTAQLVQLVDITAAGEALFPVTKGSDRYVKVFARGKKLADVRTEVKTLLDADYYNNCSVTIDLERVYFGSNALGGMETVPKVTILGVTGGSVPLKDDGPKTLTDLYVHLGPIPMANWTKVKIRRLDPNTKQESITTYNVQDMVDKGDRRNDPPLKDGDRIEIPKKKFNI